MGAAAETSFLIVDDEPNMLNISMTGLDLYLAIKKITPTSVAIMVTGLEEQFVRVAQAAIQQTDYSMVQKPIDLNHLFSLLSRIQRQQASNILKKPDQ